MSAGTSKKLLFQKVNKPAFFLNFRNFKSFIVLKWEKKAKNFQGRRKTNRGGHRPKADSTANAGALQFNDPIDLSMDSLQLDSPESHIEIQTTKASVSY